MSGRVDFDFDRARVQQHPGGGYTLAMPLCGEPGHVRYYVGQWPLIGEAQSALHAWRRGGIHPEPVKAGGAISEF